jgi:hypothetical protein
MTQRDTNQSVDKRLHALEQGEDVPSVEKRIKELEEFKRKVEVGSWLIRCTAYVIGGLVIFMTGLLSIFEKWPFK